MKLQQERQEQEQEQEQEEQKYSFLYDTRWAFPNPNLFRGSLVAAPFRSIPFPKMLGCDVGC
jgi:hypothetical protein